MLEEMKRLGQHLVIGFEGIGVPESIRKLVRETGVGNIILFRRNLESLEQTRRMCMEIRKLILEETGLPPLIMLDEEGGSVSRLAPFRGHIPAAAALGATKDPEWARRMGAQIGRELRYLGINLNLAPVMDTCTNVRNIVSGNRCFSSDPEEVARFGCAFMEGVRRSGVGSCVKHFPGAGDTVTDSHLELSRTDMSEEEIRTKALLPFRAAVAQGAEAVMTAHLLVPSMVSPLVPATVSRTFLTDILRNEMGYDGVVTTDSLEMRGVSDMYSIEESTVLALKAGADIGMVCQNPEKTPGILENVRKALEEGRLNREEMDRSMARLRRLKLSLPGPEDAPEPDWAGDRERNTVPVMEKAVIALKGPGFPGADEKTGFAGEEQNPLFRIGDKEGLNVARVLSEEAGGKYLGSHPAASDFEGLTAAVLCVNRFSDPAALADLARELVRRGLKVMAVSNHVPYMLEGFPKEVQGVVTWQCNDIVMPPLLRMMREGVKAGS